MDSVDEVAKVDGKRNSLGGSIKGKDHPDLDEEHCQTSLVSNNWTGRSSAAARCLHAVLSLAFYSTEGMR